MTTAAMGTRTAKYASDRATWMPDDDSERLIVLLARPDQRAGRDDADWTASSTLYERHLVGRSGFTAKLMRRLGALVEEVAAEEGVLIGLA